MSLWQMFLIALAIEGVGFLLMMWWIRDTFKKKD